MLRTEARVGWLDREQKDASIPHSNKKGAEVAQVYVADTHAKVPRPPKELKGFSKVSLNPGESKRVTVTLDERAFSYYDVDGKRWRYEPGEFDVPVGRSSQQIELRGKATVPRDSISIAFAPAGFQATRTQ